MSNANASEKIPVIFIVLQTVFAISLTTWFSSLVIFSQRTLWRKKIDFVLLVVMSVDQLMQPAVAYRPDPRDYQLCQFLGRSFEGLSKVFLALHKHSSSRLVIKQTNVDIQEPEHLEDIKYEVRILKSISHPNLLPLYCSFVTSHDLWTVYPFMAFGSCVDVLKARFPEGMAELLISVILLDVVQALEYLHRMGIVHRAVKGSHILIGADGRVCLAGLRKSISLPQRPDGTQTAHSFPKSHAVAMLPWMAPEILQQDLEGYDNKADTYSIGITAIELAHGCVPYLDLQPTKVLLEKLNGCSPKLCDSFRFAEGQGVVGSAGSGVHVSSVDSSSREPGTSSRFSLHFHQFVDVCLQRHPSTRPSASSLQTHSFFKQAKKKSRELLPDLLSSVPTLNNQKEQKTVDQDEQTMATADRLESMTLDSWLF